MLLVVRKPTDVMVSSYDYEFDVPMILVMDTDDFVVEEVNANEVRSCPLQIIGLNDLEDGLYIPQFDNSLYSKETDISVGIGPYVAVSRLPNVYTFSHELQPYGHSFCGFDIKLKDKPLLSISTLGQFTFDQIVFEGISFEVKNGRGTYHTRYGVHRLHHRGDWVWWFVDYIFNIPEEGIELVKVRVRDFIYVAKENGTEKRKLPVMGVTTHF